MKKAALIVLLIALLVTNCLKEDEPILCHLYGWAKSESDSTGINNLILQIKDINPDDIYYLRIRETTTRNEDSVAGFFEMDSVCYGLTYQQGTGFVTIKVDSMQNPACSTQYWAPTIVGAVDTIILYVIPK